MVGKVYRGTGFLILLLLLCAIIGSFIGDLLYPYLPSLLKESFVIGIGPLPINLKIINITFGLTAKMNFMSILGIIVGLIIYRRGF